jgi:hypothetical protein
MKFFACEDLSTDILILNYIPGESYHNLNMPLFTDHCVLFLIIILLAFNDQKIVRIRIYGTSRIF